jgi:hypothetical protein
VQDAQRATLIRLAREAGVPQPIVRQARQASAEITRLLKAIREPTLWPVD